MNNHYFMNRYVDQPFPERRRAGGLPAARLVRAEVPGELRLD